MIEFSNPKSAQRLNRFLNEERSHGMPEASNFASTDILSTFMRYLVDSFFGLTQTVDITSAFTEYMDRTNFPYSHQMSFESCVVSIERPTSRVLYILKTVIVAFGKYQVLEMKTKNGRSATTYVTLLHLLMILSVRTLENMWGHKSSLRYCKPTVLEQNFLP